MSVNSDNVRVFAKGYKFSSVVPNGASEYTEGPIYLSDWKRYLPYFNIKVRVHNLTDSGEFALYLYPGSDLEIDPKHAIKVFQIGDRQIKLLFADKTSVDMSAIVEQNDVQLAISGRDKRYTFGVKMNPKGSLAISYGFNGSEYTKDVILDDDHTQLDDYLKEMYSNLKQEGASLDDLLIYGEMLRDHRVQEKLRTLSPVTREQYDESTSRLAARIGNNNKALVDALGVVAGAFTPNVREAISVLASSDALTDDSTKTGGETR